MYFRTLVLLFTTGVTFAQDCLDRAFSECGENPFESMPITDDGLEKTCKEAQDFVKCSLKIYDTCDESLKKSDLIHGKYRYLENLKKGCNENTENYRVLSSDIGSIGSNFDEATRICTKFEKDKETEEYMNAVLLSIPKGMELSLFNRASYCSRAFYIKTCYTISMNKLWGEEFNPAMELYKSFSPYYNHITCSEDMVRLVRPHLTKLAESLEAKIIKYQVLRWSVK